MKVFRTTIYIIVAFIAGFAIAGSVQAARFELSPATGSFRAGCNSVVNIMMSTESAESDAANIIINYNPTEIEIIDTNDTMAGVQLQPGSVYDVYVDNIAETTGQIRLTGFSIGRSYNSGSGFGNFGAIQFRSLTGVGSTSLTIDYVPGSTLDSNIAEYITSNDLLSGVTNGSYTFEVGPCFDDTRAPWVTSPGPAPGSTGQPLDSNITFHILDNQSGVDITSLTIEVQGVIYDYDGVNRFSYTGDPMDYAITVNPIADFVDGALVRVEVNAEDFDNNVMSPYRWFFNEPPEPPPVPPTCEELGCPTPEECPELEEIPECVEPEMIDVPDSTVAPEERLSDDVIEFWASNRTVRLFPDSLGIVKTLVGTTYSIIINQSAFPKETESVWWFAGSSSYQLTRNETGGFYWTDIQSRSNVTAVPSHIIVNYADGTTDVVDYRMQTVPYGFVYEIKDFEQVPVADARVTVYVIESPATIWNAGAYNQSNPVWTSSDGTFGFYAPQGTYFLEVEKPGYLKAQSLAYFNQDSILNDQISLQLIPEPLTVIEEIEQSSEFIADTISDATQRVQSAVVDLLPGTEEQIEDVTDIVAPAAVGLALLNLGTAISLANILPFLYGLFTQPLLLFGRRKRKKWGVIYNSLTKMPIDLAVVRLVEAQTGRVVRTRITDKEGRYFFMAKPGIYKIEVKKPGFIFPTVHLRDAKEDFQYLDVYHGEIIQVREASRQIVANIPLDPIAAAEKPKGLVIRSYLRKAQKHIATASVFLALALLIVNPTWWMLGYLIAQLALLGLFWRLARPAKPKGWGIVYDKETKKPLVNAIVRIFDAQYNKLLETQVTDPAGKYSFLVGNNKYFATYDKPGYVTKKLSPIDYTKMKEKSMVAYDVGLDKHGKTIKEQPSGEVEEQTAVEVSEAPPLKEQIWKEEGVDIRTMPKPPKEQK